MRRVALILLMMVVMCVGGMTARAEKMKIQIEPDALGGMLSDFDDGKFTGDVNWLRIYGVQGGKLDFVITNAAGKTVFKNTYNCKKGSENPPDCSIELDDKERAKIKPYKAQDGEHTFRIFINGAKTEAYTFKYKIATKTIGGNTEIRAAGDWDLLGKFDKTWNKLYVLGLIAGSFDYCTIADPQVQLFKDGAFLAKGDSQPGDMSYNPCSTSFHLFHEDGQNFSVWVSNDEVLATDGEYELKVFVGKTHTKTYAFTVTDKQLTSAPPPGIQSALLPENMNYFSDDKIWFYANYINENANVSEAGDVEDAVAPDATGPGTAAGDEEVEMPPLPEANGQPDLMTLGNTFCGALKKNDFDGFIALMHPNIVEFMVSIVSSMAEKGKDPWQEMKDKFMEDARKNPLESCKITGKVEKACSADDKKQAEKMGISLEKCGDINIKFKYKGKEANVNPGGKKIDALHAIKSEGKWFLTGG